MKSLTVFTPTYNRKHTLQRTFKSLCSQTCKDFDWIVVDDGSSDGTREWVLELGSICEHKFIPVDWMGRINTIGTINDCDKNSFVIRVPFDNDSTVSFNLFYIYKPNGGLYTGYNTAYALAQTELIVCVDSDDFMPNNAVEKILSCWQKRGSDKYMGLMGLDYLLDGTPIGGLFPESLKEVYLSDMYTQRLHRGDTKFVLRTELMKRLIPMEGFIGEKNFNPNYLVQMIADDYPILLLNENLCNVDYQIGADSMSQGIWRQYLNSPRSFQKMRLLELSLKRNTTKDRFRSAIHYISHSIVIRDYKCIQKSPRKLLTILALPLGFVLYCLTIYKNRK